MFLNEMGCCFELKKKKKKYPFFWLFQVNWDTAYGKVGHKLICAYKINFLQQDIVQIHFFQKKMYII